MNPIMIVVTALAALTAALVVAYTRSERFREIVDEIGRVIREVFVTRSNMRNLSLNQSSNPSK